MAWCRPLETLCGRGSSTAQCGSGYVVVCQSCSSLEMASAGWKSSGVEECGELGIGKAGVEVQKAYLYFVSVGN